jgi:hypothetical protein
VITPLNNEESTGEPLVCGVPQSSLERFLRLIRDGYPKAELATIFLEERAGITNVQSMANVRDALSHLATFLDPILDFDKRNEQVANAEEHFRRAIIEPYQIAVEDITAKVAELYEKYKEFLLPVKDRHPSLQGAPNEVQVNAKLREVQNAVQRAREAKGRNRWDEQWESGVQSYISAFDLLKEVHSDLETYWYRFEQSKTDKRHTLLHVWGIVATAIALVLGVVVSYLLYLLAKH